MKRINVLFGVLASILIAGNAAASEAICEIQPSGEKAVRIPCRFTAEKDGSFTLESVRENAPLYDEILVVSLAVTEKGIGQVSGLTKDGINSRWGEAKRESADKACWKGEDFRICARAK